MSDECCYVHFCMLDAAETPLEFPTPKQAHGADSRIESPMKNVLVVCRQAVSEEDMRDALGLFGGTWRQEATREVPTSTCLRHRKDKRGLGSIEETEVYATPLIRHPVSPILAVSAQVEPAVI